MNHIRKLSDLLVKNNFKVVFGISGSGISYKFINELISRGLKYYDVSNESVAALASGTYNFFNNDSKALCVSIKGPGFTNLFSGISGCYFEKYECFSFSEDYDDEICDIKFHKKINQLKILNSINVKLFSFFNIDEYYSSIGLNNDTNGLKHFFLANKNFSNLKVHSSLKPKKSTSIKPFLNKLKHSSRPLLILGSSVKKFKSKSQINLLNLPVLTTVKAKGICDENKVNSYGIFTGVDEKILPSEELIKKSDFIITIGLVKEEILSDKDFSKFYMLDFYNSNYSIQVDDSDFLKIVSEISLKSNWFFDFAAKYDKRLEKYIKSENWLPANIFDQLNKLKKSFCLILDTGFFCTVGEVVFKADKSKKFIGSCNGRNMGISLPQAIGVSIEGFPTICCIGDGGIKYYLGELMSIIEMNLPILIIYMSDECYGSISEYIGNEKFRNEILVPSQTSWKNLFKSIGFSSKTIIDQSEFNSEINSWDFKTPTFFHCKFNTEKYRLITKNLRK